MSMAAEIRVLPGQRTCEAGRKTTLECEELNGSKGLRT